MESSNKNISYKRKCVTVYDTSHESNYFGSLSWALQCGCILSSFPLTISCPCVQLQSFFQTVEVPPADLEKGTLVLLCLFYHFMHLISNSPCLFNLGHSFHVKSPIYNSCLSAVINSPLGKAQLHIKSNWPNGSMLLITALTGRYFLLDLWANTQIHFISQKLAWIQPLVCKTWMGWQHQIRCYTWFLFYFSSSFPLHISLENTPQCEQGLLFANSLLGFLIIIIIHILHFC